MLTRMVTPTSIDDTDDAVIRLLHNTSKISFASADEWRIIHASS